MPGIVNRQTPHHESGESHDEERTGVEDGRGMLCDTEREHG